MTIFIGNIFIIKLLSQTCFGHHYSHHQESKTVYYRILCSALVVLAVIVWNWVASCVHCVKFTVRLKGLKSRTQLATQLHTTTASTTSTEHHTRYLEIVYIQTQLCHIGVFNG